MRVPSLLSWDVAAPSTLLGGGTSSQERCRGACCWCGPSCGQSALGILTQAPPTTPGLSMRLLESRKGRSAFAFEHSEEYTSRRSTGSWPPWSPWSPTTWWCAGTLWGRGGAARAELPEVGPGPSWASSHQLPPASQVLLQTSPYHVDSLLQLSDACRFQEDQEMARDLVGKA